VPQIFTIGQNLKKVPTKNKFAQFFRHGVGLGLYDQFLIVGES